MKPLSVDIIANAIRSAPENLGAGAMGERVIEILSQKGYVVVPRVPTEAMIEASNREWDGRMSHRSSGAWAAMIDAALKN